MRPYKGNKVVSYRRQNPVSMEEIPNGKSNSRRKKGMKGGREKMWVLRDIIAVLRGRL